MPTYESELAGVSPVAKQTLPTKSKHALDEERRKAKLRRLQIRDIRFLDNPICLLNNPIIEYKQGELTDALGDPGDNILKKINAGNYKVISNEDAMHVPYAA